MTGRDSDKGHRYVTALDNARCQNKWDEVPELIRKVTKHAPQKTCFLEVASAEYQVASHLQKHPSTPRPASATGLHDLIPTLLSTVNRAEGPKQDVFQAQVCLGWVHWTVNELGLAVARFPHDFGETLNELEHAGEELSPWTKTCLVKSCYLKGSAQRMTSDPYGALDTLHSLTPWLNGQLQSSTNSPQFLHWSEKLLAEAASLAGEEASKDIAAADAQTIATALGFFRLWASHPQVKLVALPQGINMDGPTEPVSRSPIWKSYYNLLSHILQQGLPYSPPAGGPERPQLASEIRRVESLCESSVLRETKFPAADSSSPEIEAWVEQVIQNWEVLCGSNWTDEELGEGGQNAVGRNVLDVLYRAATKTYHSHLILRRLFHVHCALADYDLALRALDSYIEIVTSAKERAKKAAQYGDLENDGVLLRTVSEGVTMLSCFGSEKEAEKAKELTTLLKEFSEKHVQDDENGEQGIILIAPETSSTLSQAVCPSDIAAAYRGIGIGLANWAYWTPISEDRDDIRAEAIDYLERSLAPELEDESNCSSLYTLAVLLAENRDLDGAIDYVKSALTSDAQHKAGQADFARERDLVPLWHLLALLLSAKQDFDIAERSCEAAFEQFPATVTSLAHSDRRPPKQNQSAHDQITGITHELIDKLRDREKERIIETRMTQLAFVELVEGPGAAVNHSEQLLSLFATLFHSLNLEGDEKGSTKTEHLVPPKSSAGTVKSLRGSIFGRHRGPRGPDRRAEFAQESKLESSYSSASHGSSANTDSAPAIQVTDGEKPSSNDSPAGQLRKRSSTLKKGEDAQNPAARYVNGDVGTQAGPGAGDVVSGTSQQPGSSPNVVGVAVSDAAQSQSARQPLRPMAHNMKHSQQPPPTGHSKQPPEQDIRLPTSYAFDSPTRAVTKVPPAQAQKHALCILVKVWLLIAGLYRRASSFEDAHEACEEAAKQVTRVETLVASQEASARAFRERGWGVPKSTDELWADVNAERGLLYNAQARPHEAMERFEAALLHDADHPKATAGLSNLLLDIWDQKMPLQPPKPSLDAGISTLSVSSASMPNKPSSEDNVKQSNQAGSPEAKPLADSDDEDPRLLNRIAARERAFGLLSGLTKRGSSWDNSEAWYALSRAYEAEGQIQKLKEVLWWCIELEDRRPIRHWSNIGSGIYVL